MLFTCLLLYGGLTTLYRTHAGSKTPSSASSGSWQVEVFPDHARCRIVTRRDPALLVEVTTYDKKKGYLWGIKRDGNWESPIGSPCHLVEQVRIQVDGVLSDSSMTGYYLIGP